MTPIPNIVLVGMKSSGKTSTGRHLARKLQLRFRDLDLEIEKRHLRVKCEKLRFREIFRKYGKEYFRSLETATLEAFATAPPEGGFVLATGGGVPLVEANRPILAALGRVVFLDVCEPVLLSRIVAGGIPAFFPYPEDPQRSLEEILKVRRPIYAELADLTLALGSESAETVAEEIIRQLEKGKSENQR